mgnify:CR=1 FL=1
MIRLLRLKTGEDLVADIDVNEDWLSFLDFRDLEAYKKECECLC